MVVILCRHMLCTFGLNFGPCRSSTTAVNPGSSQVAAPYFACHTPPSQQHHTVDTVFSRRIIFYAAGLCQCFRLAEQTIKPLVNAGCSAFSLQVCHLTVSFRRIKSLPAPPSRYIWDDTVTCEWGGSYSRSEYTCIYVHISEPSCIYTRVIV
ncbi:hypothetical protein BX600DRAFT_181077 [Xylariales sp. PMI_506]|nr:hypothetical protein BX600DRAFT_181077 [Xylariales sp. PMI_506]